jgi:micrococcal nuclease
MMIARLFRRKLVVHSVANLGFFISSFSAVLASDFTGQIISVLDGDTIEVLHDNHPERIRLSGIDCPEKGQAFGKRAKQAASQLVFGKEVTLQTHGKDKYGRTIADVLLADGTNVNQTLVKDGWCWWYRKYALGDAVLESLEKEAREAKKGLWVDPHSIPPWEWRRQQTPQHADPWETHDAGN